MVGHCVYCEAETEFCRSRWPRGLRRMSAAARLLRLRVRILPGAWKFVSCECCALCRWRPLRWAHPSSREVLQCVCFSSSVIRCNNTPLHLQWVGRRSLTKKKEKLMFMYYVDKLGSSEAWRAPLHCIRTSPLEFPANLAADAPMSLSSSLSRRSWTSYSKSSRATWRGAQHLNWLKPLIVLSLSIMIRD